MSTMSASRTGAITLIVISAIDLVLLLLIAMYGPRLSAGRFVTASLLILCAVLFTVGGILFAGRTFWHWPGGDTPGYLRWERGFIILAVVTTAVGLTLLWGILRGAGDSLFALLGIVGYLLGAVVVVAAEISALGGRESSRSQITFYVVLAFLAQAAFGVSLLRTGVLAGWAGWTTIIWNLGWLIVFAIFRPSDNYYPVLHHVAPLVIGIAMLAGG
jgi:hypothetical protein